MTKCIIFPNGSGGVSICYPLDAARGLIETTAAVMGETVVVPGQAAQVDEEGNEVVPEVIEVRMPVLVTPAQYRPENDQEFLSRIAHKDVPAGLPFRFADVTEIPTDRTDRDLWTADFSNPDGIAGQP